MSRYFFALDINEQDKQAIAKWRETTFANISSYKLEHPPKVIPSANFHITLIFLGALSEHRKQDLMDKSTDIAARVSRKIVNNDNSHRLHLNELGLFKKPQVSYLTIKYLPNWLTELHNNLKDAAIQLAIPIENRPYLPHISLLRKAKYLITATKANILISAKSFSLYESRSLNTGVEYIPLKTWRL